MWKSIADNRLYILILVLFIPASTINLGLLTFIDDEAIRALVALEMDLSGNWITPTLHGEYYYNKPPLFNWLLSLFFPWMGYNEFTSRLVNVLCLWGFTATIFGLLRKEMGSKQAFLIALATFTCGRILFFVGSFCQLLPHLLFCPAGRLLEHVFVLLYADRYCVPAERFACRCFSGNYPLELSFVQAPVEAALFPCAYFRWNIVYLAPRNILFHLPSVQPARNGIQNAVYGIYQAHGG